MPLIIPYNLLPETAPHPPHLGGLSILIPPSCAPLSLGIAECSAPTSFCRFLPTFPISLGPSVLIFHACWSSQHLPA